MSSFKRLSGFHWYRRGYLKKIIVALSMMLTIAMASATPALAVSSITNSYWKSRTYFYTGTWGSFKTTTNYNHVAGLPINPYTSDFYTELNADHFNQPYITGYSGLPGKPWFLKTRYGKKTGGRPAWYYNSGVFWVWKPFTATLSFDAQAHRASPGWKKSGHGQYNFPWVSYGPDAYIYTYHY